MGEHVIFLLMDIKRRAAVVSILAATGIVISGVGALICAQVPPDPTSNATPPESAGTLPQRPEDIKSTSSRSGSPAPSESPDEHKGRITYGKKDELVVEKESLKPVEIKKTKYGADATEPTGVFKGSLLDMNADYQPTARKRVVLQPKASPEPKTSPAAKPQASASPANGPFTLDITTGINPAAPAAPSHSP